MDYVTFRELLKKGSKLPMLQIGRTHPLADPERPQYVDGRDAAQALFLHLETELTRSDPVRNPMWQSLLATAQTIRSKQLADRDLPQVSDETIGNDSLPLLVDAVQARSGFRNLLATTYAGEQRDQALRMSESAILRRANDHDGNAEPPAGHNAIPGLAALWAAPETQSYAAAMHRLAAASRAEARTRNQEIDRANELAEANEQAKPVEAPDILRAWLGSMITPDDGKENLWTRDFAIVMDSQEESIVAEKFIALGLDAIETKANPTGEELAAKIEAIRSELAVPAYRLDVMDANYAVNPEDEPLIKPATIAKVTREAITDRSKDYVKGAWFGEDRNPTQETVISRLDSGKPIIGLEGQKYYSNANAIADQIKKVFENKSAKPLVITHAVKGTPFYDAVIAAAELAGISVATAKLSLESHTQRHFSNTVREHNNILFTAEPTISTERKTTCTIMGTEFGKSQPEPVSLISSAGRYAARNKLVLIDVNGGNETARFTALVNHAALTPHDMIAFGHERNDTQLARILMRREYSNRTEPVVIDKNGYQYPTEDALRKAAAIAETPHHRKVKSALIDTKDLQFESAAGQAIATAAVGTQHAKTLVANFATLGTAYAIAQEVAKDQRHAKAIAQRYNLPMEALHAATALDTARRDTEKFSRIIAQTQGQFSHARSFGSDLLANPADPIVAKFGALAGFSSLRESDGSLKSGGKRPLKSVAIIGDSKPVSANFESNLEQIVKGLGNSFGRNSDGIANVRILTTFTPGVGEKIMEAALRNKIPVEAIDYADHRQYSTGSKEKGMFDLATNIEQAGLGGTWTLAKYHDPQQVYTPAAAARAAITAADSTIVARLTRDDPVTIAAAAAAQTKPLFVLSASDADSRAYSGNKLLTTPDAVISATLKPDFDTFKVLENATYRPAPFHKPATRSQDIIASVDTTAGALPIAALRDLAKVRASTDGKVDASLGRARPVAHFDAAAQNRIGLRYDVIADVDLSEYNSNKRYREKLDLTPAERHVVDEAGIKAAYAETVNDVTRQLSTRFRVAETNHGHTRQASTGYEH